MVGERCRRLPAYTSYSGFQQSEIRHAHAELDPFNHAWIFDGYIFDETNGGDTERRSVGFQTRYSVADALPCCSPTTTFAFRQLNSVTLIGNARWARPGCWASMRIIAQPATAVEQCIIGQTVQDLRSL